MSLCASLGDAIVRLRRSGTVANQRTNGFHSNLIKGATGLAVGAMMLGTVGNAQAAVVQGDFVIQVGNDELPSIGTVEALVGLSPGQSLVQLTDPVEDEDGSETSSFGTLDLTESGSDFFGDWEFTPTDGTTTVDFVLLLTKEWYAIWDYRTVAMANVGCWNSIWSDASCDPPIGSDFLLAAGEDFEALVAYSVVPIPAAGWLFLSAVVGLWVVRRRSAKITAQAQPA